MADMDGVEKTGMSLQAFEVEKTLEFLHELECVHSESVSPNDDIVAPGERECPICKKKMLVHGREGMTVDTCSEHGVWLDSGQLEAIVSKIRKGSKINIDHAYKMGYKNGAAGRHSPAG